MKAIPEAKMAEVCVLGSMIVEPGGQAISEARELVRAEDFFSVEHQTIYRALCELHDGDVPVDLVLLKDALERKRKLAGVGGIDYLAEIVRGVPNAASARYYAGIIRNKARLRKLIQVAAKIDADARAPDAEADALVAALGQGLLDLDAAHGSDGETLDVVLADARAVQDGQRQSALSTGFADIDFPTGGGLRPGQLVIVAGGTSKGKSVFVGDIARHVLKSGGGVLWVSGEMTAKEIWRRLIAAESGVFATKFDRGSLSDQDWQAANAARDSMQGWRLEIIDRAKSIPEIASAARRWANLWRHKGGLSLVIVDYLGLMTPDAKAASREQQVGGMARDCKRFASQLQVPWLVAHQLNRESKAARPELYMLRDSGQVEEHASGVLLLDWESDVEQNDGHRDGPFVAVLARVAKWRAGQTTGWQSAARLKFRRWVTRMDADDPPTATGYDPRQE